MSNTAILDSILSNPEQYKELIENANYDELKTVFALYKEHYTDDNIEIIIQSYSESELRKKLLDCQVVIINTLIK